ncbi:MAG: GDP-L-fucose synthase [Deltaproteobacteria bacterium]|uniref:GDP-L-fucose synthase family protein n=1 Tax=Desulfobacula sp. TaxID=2593537 RepID=UPI0019C198E7|nr:GDP-L-fucose synthase [Candidatus Desulfobacula maris]MBL6995757.1 GDP-L-fucose synthase [Desulfobacula sp.]
MKKTDKIFIAGPKGLVGSALVRHLEKKGFTNLLIPSHSELELLDTQSVAAYFEKNKPDYVFLAAAKVGGILANSTYPADFIYQNLMIQNNIIHQSFVHNIKKLLFLGSSCIYPKHCPQPMKEEYLMTGPLEPTNSPYAVAKIAGIEMCWSYNRQYGTKFIPVMPTNLYGPNDNFDLETSHVLPALIRKFHEARQNNAESVTVWGTGHPKREFLHVDDLADACLFIMQKKFSDQEYKNKPLFNIGSGRDISVKELAELIKEITRFKGKIVFDTSIPDGTPQKLLDISKLKTLNWHPATKLKDGIKSTAEAFKKHTPL